MSALFVYVTAADRDEARRIGQTAVEQRLAACVNIIDGMESIYWWQGRMEEASEAVLILKTRETCLNALIDHIRALHSYDCPAIVALPITAGNADYLDWITSETRPPS